MNAQESTSLPNVDVAKTVTAVANLTNPHAKRIIDRSQAISDSFVKKSIAQSVFTWEGRKPAPALDDNFNFQGTDLDLLSFMVPMMVRGAVIEIPEYQNRRKVVRREGERKIGASQFGNITGLTSNADVHSFSVRIFDRSIVVKDADTEKESVGAHRNYMLVDCDGHWYDGWNKIVWDPTRKENAFLADNKLWTGNSVVFQHYVHPNRKQSIFGAPYLLLKMLAERLTDEATFYRKEVKRLEALGFSLPKGEKKSYVPPVSEGATKKVHVQVMETALDGPDFIGEYAQAENSDAGLLKAYRHQKHLTYTLKPLVQFVVRADEVAYFKYGCSDDFIASWIQGITWKDGYRVPRGKVDWKRLEFSPLLSLRYRVKEVTQTVSAS